MIQRDRLAVPVDEAGGGSSADAALAKFREIGMTGWVTRAEEVQQQID